MSVAEPAIGSLPTRPEALLTGARAILVFVGIFLAVLMGGLDALVVSTALPTIALDLHQASGITFVVSAYLIASTVAIPIFARISDGVSRRNVFIAGLAIFIVGSSLAGASQNLAELIAFRGVQGFGIGGLFPVAIAMVAVLYPPEVRTKVTALLAGAAGISIVAGPLLGSYIVDTTTWRWVFYINLPIGIAGVIILSLGIGALKPSGVLRFDWAGAATLSAWVAALMFALVQVSEGTWAWGDPRTVGLLVAAGVLFLAFLAWELRTPDPLVPLRLLRIRVLASCGGTAFFNGIVFGAAMTFLSLFVGLVLFRGSSSAPNEVRDMLYFFAVPMIIGAVLSAPLLARLSYRAVTVPSLAVAAISCLFLTTLTATTPLWVVRFGFLPVGGLVLPLIPMGVGSGLALGANTLAVQSEAPLREVGASVGIVRFLQSLGAALGLSLLSAFQTWRYGELASSARTPSAVSAALVTSYDEVFLIVALLIGLAFGFALFLVGRLPTASSQSPPARAEPSEGPRLPST